MKKQDKFENKKWIHKADLLWIVDGNVRETILSEQPYATCRKKLKELKKHPDYRGIGKLVVISHRSKNRKDAIEKELKK